MYIDPGFAGMLMGVIISIVTVGGVIWYSAKRKARKLLKKDKPDTPVNGITGDENDEIIDTLENVEEK
ncbi:MAG: hypothetical protein FWD99_05175 [Oscillospiraceae bacterium]|nr:hypothetical protein [Oscillospiraceae bacterium]